MMMRSSDQAADSFDNPVYEDSFHQDPVYKEVNTKEDLEKEINLESCSDDTYVHNELPCAKRNSDDTELLDEKRSSDDKESHAQ